jgi:hypothetical protein
MSCITEILKLKGENDVFIPEGNWIAVEGGGIYKDCEYLIVLNSNGHRCGYVAIPSFHPASKTPLETRDFFGEPYEHYDYDGLDIDCHGGLTFMSPTHGLKKLLPIACNDMWIGFDCGHHGDSCDIQAFKKYFGEELAREKVSFFDAMNFGGESDVKDFNYAQEQCHYIIDQLVESQAA